MPVGDRQRLSIIKKYRSHFDKFRALKSRRIGAGRSKGRRRNRRPPTLDQNEERQHVERKEYLLSELPVELGSHCDAMDFAVPVASMGFTTGGVRYRTYRDERAKATAKAMAIDLVDALKGADVAAEEIEAAMDALGYDTEERRQAWAEIAAIKRGNENGTD